MQSDVQEHQRRAERLETLIQEVSSFPDPHARATTEELIQTLLDMYGEGLARILDLTAETNAGGQALITALAGDDLVGSLFLLHGLHPVDIGTRIAQALVEVRPYMKSHGGNVEFIGVEDGIAYLRLEGSCHGCPSSTITLKLAIEEAIYKVAPDLEGLRVEGVVEPPQRAGIPVKFVPTRRRKEGARPTEPDGAWTEVEGLHTLVASGLKALTIQQKSLLFCKIADTYYAYHNRCSSCEAALDSGRLEGTTLICPSCGQHYDVCRAGRSLDAPDLFLEPVPLLTEGGRINVALSIPGQDDQSQVALSAPGR